MIEPSDAGYKVLQLTLIFSENHNSGDSTSSFVYILPWLQLFVRSVFIEWLLYLMFCVLITAAELSSKTPVWYPQILRKDMRYTSKGDPSRARLAESRKGINAFEEFSNGHEVCDSETWTTVRPEAHGSQKRDSDQVSNRGLCYKASGAL